MRNVFAILFFALTVFSCNSAKNEFLIKGSIEGVDTGKVYMLKLVNGQPQNVDTADVTEGKFTFKGNMETPDLRILRLDEREYFAQFFLENSDVEIKAKKDSLRATRITGSPSQDIFKIYITEMEKFGKEMAGLQQRYQNAAQSGNTEEIEKARIDYQSMTDNNKVYSKNFVKEHSNSVVSAFIVFAGMVDQLKDDELDSIVSNFSPEIGNSEYIIKLKEIVAERKKTAIGNTAPDFTMNTPDDKPIMLSSLRGKTVLIDFWASWCGPCRQENPNVVKLYQQYHEKGFEILGVSLDKSKDDWVNAIKDDKLEWLHVSDLQYWQSSAAALYNVKAIPQSFLIDQDGKIIAKGLRGEALANKLAEIFPN
jgi:peroxiredoxin